MTGESPQSRCPICAGERLPGDASRAGTDGSKVKLAGRVNAVIHPGEASYTPFGDYCTVALYPRRGSVKYLKFRTSQEMDRLGLKQDDRIQVDGCSHDVDGKELVFDIQNVVVEAEQGEHQESKG